MKRLLFAVGLLAAADVRAAAVSVDFSQDVAPLRPALHSSGFGPTICSCGTDEVAAVKSMGFKAARTHDWALINNAERVCDWYHIFPLMHLDATDPKNYCFAPTDHLLRRTREETGLEVFFRLGSSIEHSGEVHFNTLIPDDLDKLVEVFAGTVRHYNAGWADGFKWNIRYWEIWNEPDGANMWTYNGADAKNDKKRNARFTELYVKSLKRLKGEFPDIKVGGPATWFPDIPYHRMLLDACKKEGVKPDFVSWHSYDRDPAKVMKEIGTMRALCDEYGLKDCELIINEWHFLGDYGWPGMKSRDPAVVRARWEGPHSQVGIGSSCYNLTLLAKFQTSPLDQAYFYGCKHFGLYGFRDERHRRNKVYYGLRLFGDFLKDYKTICKSVSDAEGVTVLAARDGAKEGVLVVDYRSGEKELEVILAGGAKGCRVFVHDDTRDFEEIPAVVRDGKLILEKKDAMSAAFLIKRN